LITIQRLWDSYLSDGADGFKTFHLYVCAAFLFKWHEELRNLDFQDTVVFLWNPSTESWNDRGVEMLVAEVFAHLRYRVFFVNKSTCAKINENTPA
jgi:TBC1 domain family member 2